MKTNRNKQKQTLMMMCFIILPILGFSQRGYFFKDSTSLVGIRIINGGSIKNAKICQAIIKNRLVTYTPYEVKEYGFKEGEVYISKRVKLPDSTQQVFLERVVVGKINLYYYKEKKYETFFLEKDSTFFIELPKGENKRYRNQLQDFTHDCINIVDATRLTNYNKISLKKVIERYNQSELKPFPNFRYGIFGGYEFTALATNSKLSQQYINHLEFPYEGNFTFGAFLDAPILVSDYSFHLELYYSQHSFSVNKMFENNDIDFLANISSIKMPVLLRYTFPTNKIRPFIDIGGIGAYNFKNENWLFEAVINNDYIEINDIRSNSIISKYQIGFAAGAGIEITLNYKHSLFFELRYNQLFDAGNSKTLNDTDLHFITGINF